MPRSGRSALHGVNPNLKKKKEHLPGACVNAKVLFVGLKKVLTKLSNDVVLC